MKFSILLDILFDLLSKRKVTAAYLAEKYEVSPRTVYRYVELLASKLPLSVKRGRNGGICLSDSYRLPVGFMSADEYAAAIEALVSAYTAKPEPRFLEAKRKLSAQIKTEKQTLVVSGEIGAFYVEDILPTFSEKLRILEECIRNANLAEIEYLSEDNERISTNVEPHALLLCKGVWYVYAFCHQAREFQLVRLGRIYTLIQTKTPFRKRSFEWSEIPCLTQKEKYLSVRLAISEKAVERLRDKLGIETLRKTGDKRFAEVSLPDDERTVNLLLGLGKDVEVVSPLSLREKVHAAAKEIVKKYE